MPPAGLLPYQQRWVADSSPVRVWEKSRRIGASWTCALESVLFAGKKRSAGGCDTWYSSYNRDTTAEYIRDCAFWCGIVNTAYEYIEGTEIDEKTNEEVLTFTIRFPTGFKIVALSSRPENLRNRKGRIIIDEAAFRALKEAMKAAMPILMWGGTVDILSTHNGVDSEFNQTIEDIRAKKLDYSLHRTTIDDAVSEGLYQRICAVTGKEWTEQGQKAWLDQVIRDNGEDADEELRCVPKRSSGTYISRLAIEDCMAAAPVYRFDAPDNFSGRSDEQRQRFMASWLETNLAQRMAALPKDRPHYFGEDFGRTIDITVIAPCYTTQTMKRVFPFLLELRNTPFLEQELSLKFIIDRLPQFRYGALDATGNGQYLAERAWQKYGESRIEQVHLSRTWYAEQLPPLKAAFEDGIMQIPRDEDVLNDVMAFRRINGIPLLPDVRKPSISTPTGRGRKLTRHGDSAIALALAHYASRQQGPVHDGYESAGKRTAYKSVPGGSGFGRRSGGIL